MSANDILDVLNIQRDQHGQEQPSKKKQRVDGSTAGQKQSGISRELYNLIGPNTPPINLSGIGGAGGAAGGYSLNSNHRMKPNARPSPWTRKEFKPQDQKVEFYHWMKGSKQLLEQEEQQQGKSYFFDKFNTKLSLPELVDEETYESYVEEFKEAEKKERERIAAEKLRLRERAAEKQREREEKEREKEKAQSSRIVEQTNKSGVLAPTPQSNPNSSTVQNSTNPSKESMTATPKSTSDTPVVTAESKPPTVPVTNGEAGGESVREDGSRKSNDYTTEKKVGESSAENKTVVATIAEVIDEEPFPEEWSYNETAYLFELCNAFELKWPVIADRYTYPIERSQEDLKEHFYRVCYKILEPESNSNPNLLESLKSYSKTKEVERKHYLENLLKRTPAEIAEEESLVIEARRFELAAKKMLVERSYLLNLLDSPQTSQSVQQYQSSQGLATLYNNLMIMDKHQKKRQQLQLQKSQSANGGGNNGGNGSGSGGANDPVPPAIPIAASSSFKKERTFQTHLQQYLSGILKQQGGANKHEPSAIQQLLSKRLTVKEEEAYGLHYHANEKIAPGVTLRSAQRLPGLQQRQSVLKSVNNVLQEMDIPTAGGTNWKPVMPTRKTMAKYDTLLRAVVALLDVKKGKDKLESEIRLIKAQRNL